MAIEVDTENIEVGMATALLMELQNVVPGFIGTVNIYLTGGESKPWKYLHEFLGLKVEYHTVDRIRPQKSMVDNAIMTSVIRSSFEKKHRGTVLLSSDCDFLALHKQIPDYPVCYCCVRKQASNATMKYLRDNDLHFVYVDYIVNNLRYAQAKHDYVMKHVAASISASIPNLLDVVKQAMMEVSTQSDSFSGSDEVQRILQCMRVGINADGSADITIIKRKCGKENEENGLDWKEPRHYGIC